MKCRQAAEKEQADEQYANKVYENEDAGRLSSVDGRLYAGHFCPAFYLQVYASEEYQQKALDQQLRVTQLTPKRGSIYDRNMTILARSATVWTITLSPANIKSEEQKSLIAENLSRILDVAYDQIIEKANKTASYYQIIKRKVEQTETEEVRQFLADNDIQCVGVVEDSKRYYPYDNFLFLCLRLYRCG